MQPDTPSIDIDARTESLTGYLRGAFVAGAVIVVPLLVTVFAVSFAVSTLSGLLTPAVVVLNRSVLASDQFSTLTVQFVALVLVLLSFLVAGLLAKSDFGQRRVYPRIERWITSIPVLGPIYSSVNDLSEMFLDSDTESFEEVKLVEYPTEDSYSLAFVTADRRTVIDEAMGTNDTVTLFRPMAPNPMGGFLIHVPRDRVHDVDMSVDEGIQAVLSTGAALQSPDDGATPTEGT